MTDLLTAGAPAPDFCLTVTPDQKLSLSELRVKSANRAFYKTFQASPEDTEDRCIDELGNGQWDVPPLLDLLRDIVPTKGNFDDYEVTHDFTCSDPEGGLKQPFRRYSLQAKAGGTGKGGSLSHAMGKDRDPSTARRCGPL